MILKHLKIFLVHLWKNKIYAGITIFGFAISLLFILLLSIYIKNEYSINHFHEKKDRIFRVVNNIHTTFAAPSGPLLKEKFPEVEDYMRTSSARSYVKTNGTSKIACDVFFADMSFFSIFSFEIIKGNIKTIQEKKNSVVLSESFAYKFLGRIPNIGEVIQLGDRVDLEITGIMKDLPTDTHFHQFDLLVNFPSIADFYESSTILTTYSSNSFELYVLAKPHTDFQTRANEITDCFTEVNWMFKNKHVQSVIIEPIEDVYFSEIQAYNRVKQNSERFLKILSAIVFFILVLAIINYINLTIAQSSFRSREIAIKKLMGSKNKTLLIFCLCESITLSFIALFVAFILGVQVQGIFNHLLDSDIDLWNEINLITLIYTLCFTVGIGFVSGLVPALKISKFDPIEVIKGKYRMKEKNTYSKILISFQYFIIIVLLVSAFIIRQQTSFLQNYQLGFSSENLVSIENELPIERQRTFQEVLEKIPGVEKVCLSSGTPIDGGNNSSFVYNDKRLSFQRFKVDTSFFSLLNISYKRIGTAYSKDICWINEKAAKDINWNKNITTFKRSEDTKWTIYGIVDDFHFRNLKSELGPAYFQILQDDELAWSFLVRLNGKNNRTTIKRIEKAYSDFSNGIPIKLEYFDDTVEEWYRKEENTAEIVSAFAFLTIVISVMGLFAMSMFYVQQKYKEIGVRKTNGAKTLQIIKMLNSDFMKWVVLAFIPACPVAYYAMNQWLHDFPYRIGISWWVFALTGALAIVIALVTVSYHSWRAASMNPVKSLRYE